jgi:hypothetical protein
VLDRALAEMSPQNVFGILFGVKLPKTLLDDGELLLEFAMREGQQFATEVTERCDRNTLSFVVA